MHVIINGVSSETLQGVQVLSLPPITKPRMRTSVAVIDGRPGDIVTRLGYEAYNRKIRILLHHDYDIDAISAFFNTSGTIIFSNEPDMEYEFETIDAFSFERAVQYKTADITFHVQSYKLSATEQPATGEVSTLVDKTPYIIRRTPAGTRQKGTIVGGSIVWNQLCNNASVTVANGHKYLLKKDDAYSIGASTGTALTGLTAGSDMVFDLTLMFGSEIADYIYSKEQASAGAGVALAKAWAGITADYYPYDAGTLKSVEGLTAHKMTGKNIFGGDALKDGVKASMPSAVVDETGKTVKFNSNATVTQPIVEGIFAENTRYTFIFTLVKSNMANSSNIKITYTDGTTSNIPITPAINEKQTVRTISTEGKTVASLNKNYQSGSTTIYYEESGIFIGAYGLDVFEPYTVHEYPLDSSLTLRGIPKLDGDNLYYDGDVYKADGTVERRYGVVDLGTLNWIKLSGYNYGTFQANLPDAAYSATIIKFIQTSNYTSATNSSASSDEDNYIWLRSNNGTRLVVKDTAKADMTAADFATSLSGVYFVYELATPTTEQAEPYTALQICDPAGTEEWVGASMPVGHETTYIDPISMTVTNEGNTESAPSITIEGEGTVEVTVDGLNILQIQMPSSGEITIDSRTLDATDGEGGLANRSVVGDYNDLRLAPGEHTVTVTGDVTSVTIKNASRWI